MATERALTKDEGLPRVWRQRLHALFNAVAGMPAIMVTPHVNPDPDALASAYGLQWLLTTFCDSEVRIGYRGMIGRAENRALVDYLGIPLETLDTLDPAAIPPVAVVDTQPAFGNSALGAEHETCIVIDHHAAQSDERQATFVDIRPSIGATATMLTEYIQASGVEPPQHVATALFYGIKSDTLGLVRGVTEHDINAYVYLQPLVDSAALVTIEQAKVPLEYFHRLIDALYAVRVYRHVTITMLDTIPYPELVGEIADLLLRLEGTYWSICCGLHNERLICSVRTSDRDADAGKLALHVIGGAGGTAGGHGLYGGGQLKVAGRSLPELRAELTRQMLQYLGLASDEPGLTLVSPPPAAGSLLERMINW